LTSPEKRAHKIVRHLADYVLVWAGGGGDDLAKSPHMARIGNSVYSDICPGDPTCSKFGFDRNRKPTPMMAASLLYKLHSGTQDNNLFEKVFTSKYGKVLIYRVKRVSRKSKKWISSPENLICDAPGSWYCVGQYPPALNKLMKQKQAFTQLEDFNAKTEADDEYQRKYFEHLNDPNKAQRRSQVKERKQLEAQGQPSRPALDAIPAKPLSKSEILDINQNWHDNEILSNMFDVLQNNDIGLLDSKLKNEPAWAHMRSKDGRGPMWWAYEHGRKDIVKLLKNHGVSDKLKDKDGMTPQEMSDDEL